MRQRGHILTLLGRRCRLLDPDKDYVALNRALQGGNADILKLKLVEIDEYLDGVGRPVDLLLNCHDAISYQFDEDDRKHYEHCLKIMTGFGPDDAIKLDVPITVDTGEGRTWAEATWGPEK
jgi:DNA polymerase-1